MGFQHEFHGGSAEEMNVAALQFAKRKQLPRELLLGTAAAGRPSTNPRRLREIPEWEQTVTEAKRGGDYLPDYAYDKVRGVPWDLALQPIFTAKCAGYLFQGISVVIVDIVTSRRANLHNEILRVMEADDLLRVPPEQALDAVAYRPLRRGKGDEIDLWRFPRALGRALPTLPLGLRADLVIPVELESA